MRCHYMSDLHLESQEFSWPMPCGDVLILAGDVGHASCLGPARQDPYAIKQRDRIARFADLAMANFKHVLLVAGNHDHYDGIFDDTNALLRAHLPGVTVLDNDAVAIDGLQFFGTTLWSDFEGRSEAAMAKARKGAGEFFFVKKRVRDDAGLESLVKFRPHHALAAFDLALEAMTRHLDRTIGTRTIVITHHSPSHKGLNPLFQGNGLDGAYASDLDAQIAKLERVPVWVHGHTHIKRTYRIAETMVHVNCRGFDARGLSSHAFSPRAFFEI